MRSSSSSSDSCRRAFTLVEVIASLMLLGSLLVGILVAHRRHAEQIHRAIARLAAVAAADKLLTQWSTEGTWGGGRSAGKFEGRDDLTWRWTIHSDPQLRRMGAAIGRLEVMDTQSENQVPVLSIDLVTTGDSFAGGYQSP